MTNFKKILTFMTAAALLSLPVAGCSMQPMNGTTGGGVTTTERPTDDNQVEDIQVDENVYDYTLTSEEDGNFVYEDEDGNIAAFSVVYVSGTQNCYTVEGNTLTFGNLTEDSVYAVTGVFYGNIVIDAGDDYKFELEMKAFTVTCYDECPLVVQSGDKVTLSAKKDTVNYIYDLRDEVDDDGISASVYALCDLDIQGKGELYIKSVNNNGVHTKDDLGVKNLTLQIDCKDNALKGNDSVSISSGKIVLIARTGDGIKTTNSDVSAKGNQRGTVTVSGGELLIYAACDGIDAAYNVEINEDTATPVVEIYTDTYSKYSEEVTATADEVYYVRYTATTYRYSIRYFNDSTDEVWENSSSYTTVGAGMSNYYYYSIAKPSGYAYMQLYIYSSSQQQGQADSYVARTDTMAVNTSYDTIALTKRSNSLTYGWTNYTTSTSNGGFGGMGGGFEDSGNTNKGDYSTKGIKADNAVDISSGVIQISSYDDSIHANNDVALENGAQPLGDVTVSGGTLTLYTNDDGIHGDGTTTLSGGEVNINSSYEGIEGSVVLLSGATVSVTASDDGVNGTGTSGESIVISGGNLYVYAGGDGIDSNSTSYYDGLLISGGRSVIISLGSSDSSIDTENGYKYTGGYVVGMSMSGGMSSEATACSPSFSSVGSKKTLSLTKDAYLTVANFATVRIPSSFNAIVIFLGSTGASISSSSSSSLSFDGNGVYWAV